MQFENFQNWKIKNKFLAALYLNLGLLLLLSLSLIWSIRSQKIAKEEIVMNSEAIFYFMDGDMMHEGLRGDVIKATAIYHQTNGNSSVAATHELNAENAASQLEALATTNPVLAPSLTQLASTLHAKKSTIASAKKVLGDAEFDALHKECEEHILQFKTDIANIQKMPLSENVKAHFKEVQSPLENYISKAKSIFELIASGKTNAVQIDKETKAFLKSFKELEVAQDKVSDAMLLESEKLKEASNNMEKIIFVINLFLVLLSLVSILVVSRKVVTILDKNLNQTLNSVQAIAEGNIPKPVQIFSSDEFGSIMNSINLVGENLEKVKLFADAVGDRKFETDITVFNNEGELGLALSNMRESLSNVATEESHRNWTVHGLASIGEILRNSHELNEHFYDEVIKFVVKYIGANQGGIFVLDDDTKKLLELKGCYAFDRKKYVEKSVHIDEGLVGQAFHEAETIYITEVPKNYTGLGNALPASLILVPLKVNDDINGVLELASFKQYEKYEIEFLEKIAESISSSLNSLKVNSRTIKLLQQSQQQSDELRAQEEEMRQNFEEMQATQEEMNRAFGETNKAKAIMQQTLDQAIDAVITINQNKEITYFNKTAEKMFEYSADEVLGKNVKMIVPFEHREHHDEYIAHNVNTGINKVVGIARELEACTKSGSKFWILLSLSKVVVDRDVQYTAFIKDITEQKTKYDEIVKVKAELEARVKMLDKICIVSETDVKGNITYANPKFLSVAKYSLEELVGQPHNIVRHPDMPSAVFKEMWATIGKGNSFRGIVKNKAKDGTPYWVDAVIAPVLGKNGKPERYIGIRFDITEWILKEEELLKEIERLKAAKK
jgi:methyl-accepting chemotaxis protein